MWNLFSDLITQIILVSIIFTSKLCNDAVIIFQLLLQNNFHRKQVTVVLFLNEMCMVIPQTGTAVKVKKKRVIIKAFIYQIEKLLIMG